jgi:hypothetical protein
MLINASWHNESQTRIKTKFDFCFFKFFERFFFYLVLTRRKTNKLNINTRIMTRTNGEVQRIKRKRKKNMKTVLLDVAIVVVVVYS